MKYEDVFRFLWRARRLVVTKITCAFYFINWYKTVSFGNCDLVCTAFELSNDTYHDFESTSAILRLIKLGINLIRQS